MESAQSMAASLCAGPSEYDALLREVEAERRALEAAEARERGLSERLAARQRERSAAEQELAPFEAQIAEKLEEARVSDRGKDRTASPSRPAAPRAVFAPRRAICTSAELRLRNLTTLLRSLPRAQALEAKQAGERKAHDTQKRVEGASLYNSELCALLRCVERTSLATLSPPSTRVW